VVDYILDLLNEHGFTEAIFTLGYKGSQIEDRFESGKYKNLTLSFSNEDSPLGTAGCVKKATIGCFAAVNGGSEIGEDFLVISGDALCDFNLSAIMQAHKTTKAHATIITKKVDDPREYGLVISAPDGRITGFSEKPSYLNCIADSANTGVYVLSPNILDLIPNNSPSDFARDIFPKMLKGELPLYSYEEKGYWCDIGDFSTYARSQRDIINGRVKCTPLPGITCNSSQFGEHVTLGENCLISDSVIGNHTTIGNNVKINNSIILDGVYLSDNVTINHAVICNNTKLLYGANVFEGSVIGENCLIGKGSVISAGAKIWNEKEVPDNTIVSRDIKYGAKSSIELTEQGISGETNADITPELCTRLGAALSCVSDRIAISCDDNNAATSMKHAIIAGATGAGANVFDIMTSSFPQLIYASGLLDCGIIARIKCSLFTEIEIKSKFGLPLTRLDERKLEAALSRSEYKSAEYNKFGKINNITGLDEIYTSMLNRFTHFKSNYKIKLNCTNSDFLESVSPVFEKISSSENDSEILVVTLTDGGSKAEFYTEKDVKIDHEHLLLLAAVSVMQHGYDAALPNDFAACADFLAQSYGRKIHRYFMCPNDSSDTQARSMAINQPFLRDGAILALTVLELLTRNNSTIEDAMKAIPDYATERREMEITCPPQRIISKLCSENSGMGEGVILQSTGTITESVLLRSSKKGNSLFLLAQSLSSETAKELCDTTEKMIEKIISEDINTNRRG